MKIYDYKGKKNLCGDRIREARVNKKMSQSELAAKMQTEGITLERDSISRIEIGTRFITDYELMIFAKVLKVNIEWLLDEIRNSSDSNNNLLPQISILTK